MHYQSIDDHFLTHRNPNTSKTLDIPVRLIANILNDEAEQNFDVNVVKNLEWIDSLPPNSKVAIFCGSAPSLNDSYHEIKNKQESGAVIFGANGSPWNLHTNNISTDYQIILDSSNVSKGIFYPYAIHLFSSVCNPDAVDMSECCLLWHPDIPMVAEKLKDSTRHFSYIGGAISVMLYGMSLIYSLGYREIHLYGFDSSYKEDEWYAESDNVKAKMSTPDGNALIISVEENGRVFKTTYDMKLQVSQFLFLERMLKESGCKVSVYGDGLLQHTFINRSIQLLGET